MLCTCWQPAVITTNCRDKTKEKGSTIWSQKAFASGGGVLPKWESQTISSVEPKKKLAKISFRHSVSLFMHVKDGKFCKGNML